MGMTMITTIRTTRNKLVLANVSWFMTPYLPHPIEKKSYDIIDGLIDLSAYPESHREIFKRVIHTTGDIGFIKGLTISDRAIEFGVKAIRGKALIWTDVTMVQTGLKRSLVEQWELESACFIHDPETFQKAQEEKTTRAVAGLRRLAEKKIKSPLILVIGDAPTALLEAVKLTSSNELKVDLIIGIPVGFVGTEESKTALSRQLETPYITNSGTRGGSTVAASIFNALMIWSLKEKEFTP
jgi:precorrin-8X/cobalt-precorrin-8 methylmutase